MNVVILTRRSSTALLATVAIAAVAAGCGGTTRTTTVVATAATSAAPAATGLSHTALAAHADAACAKANAAIAKLPAATSIATLGDYASQAQAIGVSLRADLGKLKPTAADSVDYQSYLDGLTRSNQALAAMKTAAAKHDTGGVRSATSALAGTDVGDLASRVGLRTCATAAKTSGS